MPNEKDQIIWIVIIGSIIFLGVGVFVMSFLLFYTKRHNRHLSEKIEMRSRFDQELLRTQLEIQEQTLKTISQEIHDNIGQMLSLAKLNLAVAEEQEEGNNPRISNSHQLVSKAIQDLRDLSRSLDTDYVSEMGLERSIEYELEMIGKTGTIKTELIVEGTVKRMDKQKELILFRIVQESLNNIIKHAKASQLVITMRYLPAELELHIKDNGKGVDLSLLNEQNNSFGLGIRNMHSRAKLIGGDLKVSSTLGEGTEVMIRVPNE